MALFEDLPLEIRIQIFVTAKRNAFTRRCLRFERHAWLFFQRRMRKRLHTYMAPNITIPEYEFEFNDNRIAYHIKYLKYSLGQYTNNEPHLILFHHHHAKEFNKCIFYTTFHGQTLANDLGKFCNNCKREFLRGQQRKLICLATKGDQKITNFFKVAPTV